MNLKTLNYIHELLIKNVNDTRKDWEEAIKNLDAFILDAGVDCLDDCKDNEEYRKLRDIKFDKLKILQEAETMLQTFEEQKW